MVLRIIVIITIMPLYVIPTIYKIHKILSMQGSYVPTYVVINEYPINRCPFHDVRPLWNPAALKPGMGDRQ